MTSLFDTARSHRRRLLSTLEYKDLTKEERKHAVKMAGEIGEMVAGPFFYLGIEKEWSRDEYYSRIISPMYLCDQSFLSALECRVWVEKIAAPSHRRTYDPRITAFVKAAQRRTDSKGE